MLERDEYNALSLKPDAGLKSLWCDADIGATLKSAQAKEVLKVCSVGERCQIEGAFTGHGVFYWVRISRVISLRTPPGRAVDAEFIFSGEDVKSGLNPENSVRLSDEFSMVAIKGHFRGYRVELEICEGAPCYRGERRKWRDRD